MLVQNINSKENTKCITVQIFTRYFHGQNKISFTVVFVNSNVTDMTKTFIYMYMYMLVPVFNLLIRSVFWHLISIGSVCTHLMFRETKNWSSSTRLAQSSGIWSSSTISTRHDSMLQRERREVTQGGGRSENVLTLHSRRSSRPDTS